MPRDIFIESDRCTYCGRPSVQTWDDDLVTCSSEVCQTLAYAEMRRRRRGRPHEPRRQRFRYRLAPR